MTRSPTFQFAHIAAFAGALSLAGVACFHFPAELTSQEFRGVYSEAFARGLLAFGIALTLVAATLAMIRDGDRRLALVGLVGAGAAIVLGGVAVHMEPIRKTPYSLGLDWFIISLVVSAAVFIPIERALAVRPASPLRPEWRTDLAYFFTSHLLIQFLLLAATTATGLIAHGLTLPGLPAAVRALPAPVQFLMAVFLADLFQALSHRAYHNVSALWRIHAVHHSSRHLDWLAGSRTHIFEVLMTRGAVMLPLVVMGFSPAVLNAYVVLVGIQAVMAHTNLRIDFGWLEYVIVTPRYHHWHHARDEAYVDANYAIHLPLIDMMMGTFKRAPAGQWPEEYGVLELETVPRGFLAQTASPFSMRRQFANFVGKARA